MKCCMKLFFFVVVVVLVYLSIRLLHALYKRLFLFSLICG